MPNLKATPSESTLHRVAKYFFKKGEQFTVSDIRREMFPKRDPEFTEKIARSLLNPSPRRRVVKCSNYSGDYTVESLFVKECKS